MISQSFTPSPTLKNADTLHAVAKALVADCKGVLAADESTGSIKKRLESVGKENSDDNRREWRDLMFTAEGPWKNSAITFEETLMKHNAQLSTRFKGTPLRDVIKKRGIIPGIKTDKGTNPLPRTEPEETTTEGLDGLLERSQDYYNAGVRFAKFRTTYVVTASTPSQLAIENNAEIQARYASTSQAAGLVPIVEPEVLCNGDFTIERSAEAHIAAYTHLFRTLTLHKVDFSDMILKASMVVPGDKSGKVATPEQVGAATLHMLSKTVPPLVPGIVSLSSGLSEKDALAYFNAINKLAKRDHSSASWKLSFSFGRALQGEAMKVWAETGDVKKTQETFLLRAKWCWEAAQGEYKGEAGEPSR
ncbi:fructose-bisphosphate aldolase class-I [Neolentinus lepideus HHB14362 ss-1]|uniref:fructose-bisphosphate aldolase n=1 Tax=Neolentinus lepideus HHB14362 ss-1 TaxID=1314782 RepID=A0A165UG27_9AGAM|nr:fructose-bisphosphate aldolase class-I [Neolentinus lepideus HHB14362 ss-1]